MNKLKLVQTFGGAVSYLKDEFGDFDISAHKRAILKRIRNDPDDVIIKTAWESFLKGTHEKCKKTPRKSRIVYVWKAMDIKTGKQYEDTSALNLAKQLNVTESVIVNCRRDNRMAKKRYKITRKKAQ